MFFLYVCIYIYNCVCVLKLFSHVQLFVTYGPQPARLLCPWDSPGKNTGVGCHALFQGIFPTQGSNLSLMSPALLGRFFTTSATWDAHLYLCSKAIFLYNGYKFHMASHEIQNLMMGFLFAHQMESLF